MKIVTPDWVKDAIFYQIFPDRFAKSATIEKPAYLQPWGATPTYHAFQGGDLIGIVEKFDYLTELGINALYLNPIFQSAANHRYHTYDYFQVDPLLGGNDAFDRFLEAAHERGIRVILDGVFNHVGRGFFQFHHLLEAGAESPYRDWFQIFDYPVQAYPPNGVEKHPPNYAAWWNDAALPKLNTDVEAVREFLWEIGCYWLEKGIDGWRLDVPNEIDDDAFWIEFRRRCKTINPDAYIVGEIWDDAQRWLQGDQFDGVMNYGFARAAFGFLGGDSLDQSETAQTGLGYMPALSGEGFLAAINQYANQLYHPDIASSLLTMITSHDTPRLFTIANYHLDTARLIFLAQMTLPGAPNIYYGDEIGLPGKHDPDCRRAFPWDKPESWQLELLDDVKQVIALRRQTSALRRGKFLPLFGDEDLAVYALQDEKEIALVALNAGRQPAHFNSPDNFPILNEKLVPNGSPLKPGKPVTINGRSGRIWTGAFE